LPIFTLCKTQRVFGALGSGSSGYRNRLSSGPVWSRSVRKIALERFNVSLGGVEAAIERLAQ